MEQPVNAQTPQTTEKELSTYKFDTSKYVVVTKGVRRDAVSGRLIARMEGQDTLVPLPGPVSASRMPAALGETVEVRPLAVYAELAR